MIELIIVALIFYFGGYVTHAITNTNYRKRWKTSHNLLMERELDQISSDDQSSHNKGNWVVERYTERLVTVSDQRKFDGICFRLVNQETKEKISVHASDQHFGVNPAAENAIQNLKKYKAKADKLADEMNALDRAESIC